MGLFKRFRKSPCLTKSIYYICSCFAEGLVQDLPKDRKNWLPYPSPNIQAFLLAATLSELLFLKGVASSSVTNACSKALHCMCYNCMHGLFSAAQGAYHSAQGLQPKYRKELRLAFQDGTPSPDVDDRPYFRAAEVYLSFIENQDHNQESSDNDFDTAFIVSSHIFSFVKSAAPFYAKVVSGKW